MDCFRPDRVKRRLGRSTQIPVGIRIGLKVIPEQVPRNHFTRFFAATRPKSRVIPKKATSRYQRRSQIQSQQARNEIEAAITNNNDGTRWIGGHHTL
jgi:hypothetical protein